MGGTCPIREAIGLRNRNCWENTGSRSFVQDRMLFFLPIFRSREPTAEITIICEKRRAGNRSEREPKVYLYRLEAVSFREPIMKIGKLERVRVLKEQVNERT